MKITTNEIPGDHRDDLTPADREIESALSSLRPTGASLPWSTAPPGAGLAFRDRLMFRAGEAAARSAAAAEQAAAGRQLWAWRGAAAALLVVAAGLAVRLAGPAGRPLERVRVVYVHSADPTTTSSTVMQVQSASPPPSQPVLNLISTPDDALTLEFRGESLSLAMLAGLSEQRANYLGTREAVLRWGVRVLPPPVANKSTDPEESPTPRDVQTWPAARPARPARPGPSPDDSGGATLDEVKRLANWFSLNKEGGRL